jgi:S-adenosylmethionine:tRNA ribosyltransferase-isomerase
MNLKISDYSYELPADRIALYPLTVRDEANLLFYNRGKIAHKKFHDLADLLPENSLLFFNNTKVIPARIHFAKDTGAQIEIFVLSPILPSTLMAEAMQTRNTCTWKCTIGNLKRWGNNQKLKKEITNIFLEAVLINREDGIVQFTWNGDFSFAEIIHLSGQTPLPPYLKRKVEDADKNRYQTIYSQHDGAVAAPTAGLHFTEQVFNTLKKKNIETDFVTLHVSAGTFQPVKTENAIEHTMHSEQIVVSKTNIKNIIADGKFIVPIGTTSMRTLESVYWYGAKLLLDDKAEFNISQKDPYTYPSTHPGKTEAIKAVIRKMEVENQSYLIGHSSIYIYPGYDFKICEGIITNFHQPGSTLILLIAAFIGADWKKVYQEALQNNYRFLSYGDSSLLIPAKQIAAKQTIV